MNIEGPTADFFGEVALFGERCYRVAKKKKKNVPTFALEKILVGLKCQDRINANRMSGCRFSQQKNAR